REYRARAHRRSGGALRSVEREAHQRRSTRCLRRGTPARGPPPAHARQRAVDPAPGIRHSRELSTHLRTHRREYRGMAGRRTQASTRARSESDIQSRETMKLASFTYQNRERFGLVIDDGLYDLTDRVPRGVDSLVAVL